MAKRPHSFNDRICGFAYCTRCGLIAVSNDITRKAIQKPCPGADEDKK